jgi:hypothetical protein
VPSGLHKIKTVKEDEEVSRMRKCFRKFFPIEEEFATVKEEYTRFATSSEEFNDHESKSWWTNHGSSIPLLRSLAIKLISQTSLIFLLREKLEYL